jgi:hypothetical protein
MATEELIESETKWVFGNLGYLSRCDSERDARGSGIDQLEGA